MTVYEIISLAIAGLSLLLSIFALRNASKDSSATVEIALFNAISSAANNIGVCTMSVAELTAKGITNLSDEEKVLLDVRSKNLNVAKESYLNAIEEACAKYVDGKIDRTRFKKTYSTVVRNVVENPNLKKYFDAVTSNYKAVLRVYDEWFNLEK